MVARRQSKIRQAKQRLKKQAGTPSSFQPPSGLHSVQPFVFLLLYQISIYFARLFTSVS